MNDTPERATGGTIPPNEQGHYGAPLGATDHQTIPASFAEDALTLSKHLAAGAPLAQAFAKTFHQEPTMHVTDLNGTHLGKTITITTKHETITGTLWRVDHEGAQISEGSFCADPETPVLGRVTHHLEIGAATAFFPSTANVEVHP